MSNLSNKLDQRVQARLVITGQATEAANAVLKGITTDEWQDAVAKVTDLGKSISMAQELQAEIDDLVEE